MTQGFEIARAGRGVLSALADFLLPPRCLGCGEGVAATPRLCAACWSKLDFITDPRCGQCGLPFELPVVGLHRCAACIAKPPAFDRAVSALVYDDASRPLILHFKYGDRLEFAPLLAGLMAGVGRALLEEADLIIPVPLHRWRLWRRRFNQAALLGRALGGQFGVPMLVDGVRRVRATPSQGGLGARARARNVRGAFALNPKLDVKGRRIVLIDDVLTTGATVNAISRILRRAGAHHISVLTCARVPHSGEPI